VIAGFIYRMDALGLALFHTMRFRTNPHIRLPALAGDRDIARIIDGHAADIRAGEHRRDANIRSYDHRVFVPARRCKKL
jgi:hypothetical protein